MRTSYKSALLIAAPFLIQLSSVSAWGEVADPFSTPATYESAERSPELSPEQWAEPAQQHRPWLLRSPFANISWPKIELPSFQLLPAFRNPDQTQILGQGEPSLFETITSAPARMAARTRQAWNRGIERLKFGGNSNQSKDRGPWLGRIFGNEEPKQKGPRTIKEWMSQDRMKL